MSSLLPRVLAEDVEAPTQQEKDYKKREMKDLQKEKEAARAPSESNPHVGQMEEPNAAQKKQATANKMNKSNASSRGHTKGKPAKKGFL